MTDGRSEVRNRNKRQQRRPSRPTASLVPLTDYKHNRNGTDPMPSWWGANANQVVDNAVVKNAPTSSTCPTQKVAVVVTNLGVLGTDGT